MKKVIAIFALIFLLAAMGGCTQTKAFRMTDEEFRAKLNENLAALGSELVLPAFEKQNGTISVNGGPLKEDKRNFDYVCIIDERIILTVSPGVWLNGDSVLLTVWPEQDATEEEKARLLEEYVVLASAVIMTIDLKEDLQNILSHLKLATKEEGILDYDSYHMAYESNVRSEDRIFKAEWMR